jgi:hypothetical protein
MQSLLLLLLLLLLVVLLQPQLREPSFQLSAQHPATTPRSRTWHTVIVTKNRAAASDTNSRWKKRCQHGVCLYRHLQTSSQVYILSSWWQQGIGSGHSTWAFTVHVRHPMCVRCKE